MDSDLTSLVKYAALNIQLQLIRTGKDGFMGGGGERYYTQNFTKCRRKNHVAIYDGIGLAKKFVRVFL